MWVSTGHGPATQGSIFTTDQEIFLRMQSAAKMVSTLTPPFFALLAAATMGVLAGCSPGDDESASGGRDTVPREPERPLRLVVYPLVTMPPEAAASREKVHQLQTSGNLRQLPEAYVALIEALGEAWGEENPGIVPHHYNFCLALKLLGRQDDCLSHVGWALKRWPDSLQHRLLDATLRMEISSRAGYLLQGTGEAVKLTLREENYSKISRLRVRPAKLHLQWANALFRVGRPEQALRQLKVAVRLGFDKEKTAALEAQVLVQLRRSDEAIPLLKELRTTDDSPELALALGTAYMDLGDAAAAWEILGQILEEKGDSPLEVEDREAFRARLRSKGAAALNRLRRHAEARSVILEQLLRDPQDDSALHQLATALRGLQLVTASEAIIQSFKELAPHVHHVREKNKFRRMGHLPSSWYHQARAHCAVDRLGDALQAIEVGFRYAPRAATLHLLKIETMLRLGRYSRAVEAARSAFQVTESPIFRLAEARALGRLGKADEAREILGVLAKGPENSERNRALEGGYRVRVLLELGELEEAESQLATVANDRGEALAEPAAMEIGRLCRAEILLSRGQREEARDLLRQEMYVLEGGQIWARALRLLARVAAPGPSPDRGHPPAPDDVSDLVDRPVLLERALSLPEVRESTAARSLFRRANKIHEERFRILTAMDRLGDTDAMPYWKELLELYLEGGARRKARETAWYLWNLNPGDLEESRALSRTLSRDTEVVSRLATATRGLARAAGNPDLLEVRRAAREFLGVSP